MCEHMDPSRWRCWGQQGGGGCYGTFRRYSLAGRSMSLGHALRGCRLPLPVHSLTSVVEDILSELPAKVTGCHVSFTIRGLPPATVVNQDKLLLCHFWSRVFLSQQKRSDTLGLTRLIFTATLWGIY